MASSTITLLVSRNLASPELALLCKKPAHSGYFPSLFRNSNSRSPACFDPNRSGFTTCLGRKIAVIGGRLINTASAFCSMLVPVPASCLTSIPSSFVGGFSFLRVYLVCKTFLSDRCFGISNPPLAVAEQGSTTLRRAPVSSAAGVSEWHDSVDHIYRSHLPSVVRASSRNFTKKSTKLELAPGLGVLT
jgi:hypothetical protein